MLGDGGGNHPAPVGNRIALDFLAALHKGTDDNRVLLGHLYGHVQEDLQVLVAVAYIHSGAGKHVGRAHQHRKTYLPYEFVYVIHGRKLPPARLVNAQFVHNL